MAAAGPFAVRTIPTGGNPVVYGEWLGAPGKPTVLVYGHYDVQPPDPLDKWHSPPWTPTVRDGRLYARGVSDDKGPMLIPIAVAEAFFATAGPPARQHQVHVRGRGGDRQPPPRRVHRASTRRCSPPTSCSRPTARCGASTSRRSPWRAAGSAGSSSRSRPPRRICTRAATAAVWRTRCTRWPSSSPRCTSRRPRGRRRVLRRGPRAVAERARRDCRVALRRARVPRAGRRAVGVRRTGLHDARAPVDAAHARGQRHVGRLPGPGPEDRDPERGARQDHLPARAGSGSGRVAARVARHLEAHVPPGTRLSHVARRPRLACRAHCRPITSRCRRRTPRCRRPTACGRWWCAWAAPCRSRSCSSATWGSTPSSSLSPRQTRTSTRRTSSSACTGCTKGSRPGRATGTILGEASA